MTRPILLIGNALDAAGATETAVFLTERQLTLQPPTSLLLDTLALWYTHLGDSIRASDYANWARALNTPPSK